MQLFYLKFFVIGILLFSPIIALPQGVGFQTVTLSGTTLNNPTSLQFGPDGRLYVGQQNGIIYAYTITRTDDNGDGTGEYKVTDTETINEIFNIPNHNDDGTFASYQSRQLTGLMVTGTIANPVLYVSSSDPRIGAGGGGTDLGLDTNSGIITRLKWNGSSWEMVHVVRGLPRSEENHACNGLALDANAQKLYVAIGGNTNAGGPSNNFALTTEYSLAAAVISIDLGVIENLPIKTDSEGQSYLYDLPTLNFPNTIGGGDVSANHVPFGGDDGLNQALIVPGGPVQVYAPGFRNLYDIVITENGRMYGSDNGPNGGWGGHPYGEGEPVNGVSSATNQYIVGEPGSATPGNHPSQSGDPAVNNFNGLHHITQGYYGGHPNPIRANPAGAGLYKDNEWLGPGHSSLPATWPPVPVNMANPIEGDYQSPGQDDGSLAITSGGGVNGICEYTASNFDNALKGVLLGVHYSDKVLQFAPGPNGEVITNCPNPPSFCNDIFADNFGNIPLDIVAQGDNDIFSGTVWVANYGSDDIALFEPADFGNCTGADDASLDEDFDGYNNADEIANGSNPCSGASKPSDNDKDFISDRLDPDDDNDGIPDLQDAFAIDATNGMLNTEFPQSLSLFNSGDGFYGLKFTGLMSNGTDDYLDLKNPNGMLIAGGAAGLFTVVDVPAGDALGADNTLAYGYQFGINPAAEGGTVNIKTQIIGPFFDGLTPANNQSQGLYIGTGDQDNYIKIALHAQGGTGGFQIVHEVDGNANIQDFPVAGAISELAVGLILKLDLSAQTVQPYYTLGDGEAVVLGNPIALSGGLLDAALGNYTINGQASALAVGLLATSSQAAPFDATWDYVEMWAGNETHLLQLSDNHLRFRGQLVQTSSSKFITLSNLLHTNIDLLQASITGPGSSAFSISSNFPISDISAASTAALDVVFNPNTSGIYNAHIRLDHTGDNSPLWLNVTGAALDDPSFSLKINTGGTNYMDSENEVWSADRYFQNGNTFITSTVNIQGTNDPALYKSERYGDFTYEIPVTGAGNFNIRLHFAEIYHGINGGNGVGQRIFDVDIENGQDSLANFDITAEAGSATALIKEFNDVPVSDGSLSIEFHTQVDNAKLSAIEVNSFDVPAINPVAQGEWNPEVPSNGSNPVQRHEAGYVRIDNKFYLLGGRGNKAVSIYNPITRAWTSGAQPPIELHHIQPVEYNGKIYVIGALTGGYPNETPVPDIYIYDPAANTWAKGDAIPTARQRGSAGVAVIADKIYVACGITNGHVSGHVTWVDRYDPQTGNWVQLADAPRPRDHFQASFHKGKLYLVGGRTSKANENVFANTIAEVDVYDVATNQWTTLSAPLPTQRAGTFNAVLGDELIVMGGESLAQSTAHQETEALNTITGTWRTLAPMLEGRHGTGAVVMHDNIYVASGSGNRGGGPELTTQEYFTQGNLAPLITDLSDRVDSEGAEILLQVDATDPENEPLTYNASGLPPGLAIDNASGLITGTIAQGAAFSSPYEVFISVSDQNNLAVEDTFIWTVNQATFIDPDPDFPYTLIVYPNPFGDEKIKLEIQGLSGEDLSLELLGLDGRLIWQNERPGKTKSEIDLSDNHLSKGIYFLRVIIGDKGSKVLKIMKWE